MKLIDADKLIVELKNLAKGQISSCPNIAEFFVSIRVDRIIDILNAQPTAFDVEKVVVQLETQSEMNLKKGLIEVLPDEARPYLKAVESYDKAIEIVKRGGIDE